MELHKGNIQFFQGRNDITHTFYKMYKNNNKNKKEKQLSISLSPSSTNYLEISENKSNYPKISFDQKLQITQNNKSTLFKTKLINLEKEIKEKENNILKFQREKIINDKYKKEQYKKNNKISFLKQKFNKLIKEHHTVICDDFISKANIFNTKIFEYFNGTTFIKQKVKFHKNFRFNSDFEAHPRIQMLTNINKIKQNTEFSEKLDFQKYFNEKEKDLITKDSNFFIKEISKFNNIKLFKEKKLVDKINDEEKFLNKNKSKNFKTINHHIKSKSSLILDKDNLNLFTIDTSKFKDFHQTKIKFQSENCEEAIKEANKQVNNIIQKEMKNEKNEEQRLKKLEEYFKKLHNEIISLSFEKLKQKNKNEFKFFDSYLPFTNKKEYSLNQNSLNLKKFSLKRNFNLKNFKTLENKEDEKKLRVFIHKITDNYKQMREKKRKKEKNDKEENDTINKENKKSNIFKRSKSNYKFKRNKTFYKSLNLLNT